MKLLVGIILSIPCAIFLVLGFIFATLEDGFLAGRTLYLNIDWRVKR